MPPPARTGSGATTSTRPGSGGLSIPTAGSAVTVGTGDSLWAITKNALGPGATTAQIAATWPQVYRANAGAIGSNPSIIRPGQVLRFPALKV